ncbi:phosphotransacetylase family protein [Merismopedia glauca]|uniref:DRTGG domain-containing protein n=1 Tax=Merismopedia glauca CCAP 1448/3 TaxID=1296344 RepID=A0A2T1C0I6_9CYAN|nr:phosphotransacetylase family protein [Merismopedia glauca]PSB01795.1 hypothetical protein C7B64_16530 [Merismopedia glauca CCAP 1448/3]
MTSAVRNLLIGSTEAYSGKSAAILGIAYQLQQTKLDIAYGKHLGTSLASNRTAGREEDLDFIAEELQLSGDRIHSPLLFLDEQTIHNRLQGQDPTDYPQKLRESVAKQSGELILWEGPGTIAEGKLFDLSLVQTAQVLDASVFLVARFHSIDLVDSLLAAKEQLGKYLLGVLINDVPTRKMEATSNIIRPFLEAQGIPVFGILPRSGLLRSVSVKELVNQLRAEVLCRPDKLDLMVESLTIGAMNVSSALEFFRKGLNMAVVTGGDRTEIQLAALETSTQCLILTGHIRPQRYILNRAEDLEIPVLSVDLDTLTTVEIIDRAFGNVRVHEPIKVHYIHELMAEHFDLKRFTNLLGF